MNPPVPFYLLGILNSKLIYTWLYNRGKRKGQMLELYRTPLSGIPIALGNADQKSTIEQLVIEILDIKGKNPGSDITILESEINRLVYEIYNLTTEEITVIEAWFSVLDLH